MVPYWKESFGNPHSSEHIVGWKANEAVEKAQETVAQLIGADTDEIVFTSGATEANNLALIGMAPSISARPRVAVSPIEHKCVLASARTIRDKLGFEVERLRVDPTGVVDFEHLEAILSKGISICSVGAVNNEIGTIQDIERISEACRRHGTLFHCDAAQAPVALDITALARSADLISLSAHKMYGPMGIGALFVRRELQGQIVPGIVGGGQQNNIRSGTLPLPLVVGFGAAAEQLTRPDAHEERERVAMLRNRLANEVLALDDGFTLNGPSFQNRHPGNLNVCFRGFDAQDILASLQPKLAASSGSACTSGIPEPSHVLRAIGLDAEDAEASVRFSIGRLTNADEIISATELIADTIEKLR